MNCNKIFKNMVFSIFLNELVIATSNKIFKHVMFSIFLNERVIPTTKKIFKHMVSSCACRMTFPLFYVFLVFHKFLFYFILLLLFFFLVFNSFYRQRFWSIRSHGSSSSNLNILLSKSSINSPIKSGPLIV